MPAPRSSTSPPSGAPASSCSRGPPGSGKSTIIDAITFALYGKVAQASADVERIHSHHADPRTVPVVDARLRDPVGALPRAAHAPLRAAQVARRAAPPCSSRRSSCGGCRRPTTSRAASCSRPTSATATTRSPAPSGLTRDQFVQTVILPQGEFATFLRARSEDKGKLLEKVFGTAFFRRVQDEIVEAGRAAQARRQSAVDEIRLAVHALAVSAGLETERRDVLEALSRTAPGVPRRRAGPGRRRADHARAPRGQGEPRGDRDPQADGRHGQRRPAAHAAPRAAASSSSSRSTTSASRRWPSSSSARRSARARQARPVAGAVRTLAQSEATLKRAEAALAQARARVDPALRDRGPAALREAAAQAA